MKFQPTPPAQGATRMPPGMQRPAKIFQPTPPAQGATGIGKDANAVGCISTHAPRTGGDHRARPPPFGPPEISTHAPRTGGDPDGLLEDVKNHLFQPTPPAQGATCDHFGSSAHRLLISTHAPRTGGDLHDKTGREYPKAISTHAPRTGGDSFFLAETSTGQYFNPRPPHRGRLIFFKYGICTDVISTHAPSPRTTYSRKSCC